MNYIVIPKIITRPPINMIIEIVTTNKLSLRNRELLHIRLKKALDTDLTSYTMQFFENGEAITTIGEFH